MLEILNLALNNEYIYIGIIIVLLLIIVITILSIKKDRAKMVKKVKEIEPTIEPAKTEEEQQKARLELDKLVNEMKNDLDNKPAPVSEIKTYEQEQEEKAIISYQELVEAVRKNNGEHKPQTEVGMEVADQSVIETPSTVEEKLEQEAVENRVDDLMSMLNNNETPVYQEITVEDHVEEYPVEHQTVTETSIYEVPSYEEPIYDEDVDISSNSDIASNESVLLDKLDQIEEPINDINDYTKEERKFQTSEFISPIYGKQQTSDYKPSNDNVVTSYSDLNKNVTKDEPLTREARANYIYEEPVDLGGQTIGTRHPSPDMDEVVKDDLSNSDEFLDALKNFRSNL